VRALAATGDRWTLLIALALAPGKMRLRCLHGNLPGVSAGVLERRIQAMVALGLVTRTRFKEMPPRVELELTDAGRELLPVAGVLARWGMRHLWSPPRAHEQVELGALLRLLPVLLEEQGDLPEGSVEVLVADAEPPVRWRYCVQHGHIGYADAPGQAAAGDPASARIEGSLDAWVAALGPLGERERLLIEGDAHLAGRVLDALPR